MAMRGADEVSLTAGDLRLLRQLMVEVAAETAARHVCRFNTVDDEAAKEAGHAVGVVADVGRGDLRAGLESMRESLKWTVRVRDRFDQVGLAAAVAGVGLVVTAVATALWIGIKNSLK